MKRLFFCVFGLALAAFVVVVGVKLHRQQRTRLPGGDLYLVRLGPAMDAEEHPQAVTKRSVERAIAVFEKRLNPNGSKDLLLRPVGEDLIEIQIGRGEDEDMAMRREIEQVAKLEFRLVRSHGEHLGYVSLPVHDSKPDGEKELLVKNRADLDGNKHVKQAFATRDPFKGWLIIVKFDAEGTKLFAELTRAHVHERLAIVVDGVIISAPNLNGAIEGGSAEISGRFSEAEARSLASALDNPLENPIMILKSSTVPMEAEKTGP